MTNFQKWVKPDKRLRKQRIFTTFGPFGPDRHIYSKLHPIAAEYTFFSNTQGIFSRTDHVIRPHKKSLDKAKIIEIIPSIFSNHNRMTLEVNRTKTKIKICGN